MLSEVDSFLKVLFSFLNHVIEQSSLKLHAKVDGIH